MTAFHIRENGEPGPCVAQPGNCRYGSAEEHYSTPEDARHAFEQKVKGSEISTLKRPRKVKPKRPEDMTTEERFGVDENTQTTIRLNGLNLDLYKVTEALGVKELQAYGYAGSQLYGLNTEESDIDLAVISEGKGKDKQKIIGEMDFRVYPIDKMMNRLWVTSVPETDLLFSRSLTHLTKTHEELLEGFRLNSLKYYDNSISVAINHMPRVTPDLKNIRREYKALKASARSILLANKMLSQREDFNPVFTDQEKEHYWDLMERYTDRAAKGEDWESLFNGIHSEAKALHKSI